MVERVQLYGFEGETDHGGPGKYSVRTSSLLPILCLLDLVLLLSFWVEKMLVCIHPGSQMLTICCLNKHDISFIHQAFCVLFTDWYNLEKSKRVKAFRCGEFDDCIERAEASFGLPAKKREKYARREDAILHALELEKQFVERKNDIVGKAIAVEGEHSLDFERKDLIKSSKILENGNGKLDVSNLIERESVPHLINNVKDESQMRDISSFGFKGLPCVENFSDSDSKTSLGKTKRPLEGSFEETHPKRHESLNSIVKVRKTNLELHDRSFPPSVPRKGVPLDGIHRSMYLPSELHETFITEHGNEMEMPISRLEVGPSRSRVGNFGADTTSGSSEETESDSSETHSMEAHMEAGAMISDAETCISQSRMLNRLKVQAGHESTSSEGSHELPLDDRSLFYFHDPNRASGVSKWQLKGKRNIRNINKRPIDHFLHGTHLVTRGRSTGQWAQSQGFSYYHDNGYTNENDYKEDDFHSHFQGFNKGGYLPSLAQARKNFIGHNIHLEDLTWGRQLRGLWEDRGVYFSTMFGSPVNGHEFLMEVDLQVQANRQGGEHVPWVSLMSRLNGKAIIGHPIQIETLDDGSTDVLISTSDVCGDVRYDIDRTRVPPVWRTAKRTSNFRVPRHQACSSQLDNDDDDDNYEYIHQSGKVGSKNSLTLKSVRKTISMKKKSSRKPNLSSSQKIKTLSSIASNHKYPTKRKEETSSNIDGVMKSLESGPTTIACIPVKLVFSRLLEAVGRPPSKKRDLNEQK